MATDEAAFQSYDDSHDSQCGCFPIEAYAKATNRSVLLRPPTSDEMAAECPTVENCNLVQIPCFSDGCEGPRTGFYQNIRFNLYVYAQDLSAAIDEAGGSTSYGD